MNLRKDHYRNGLGEATSRGRPELERAFDISSSLLCKSDLLTLKVRGGPSRKDFFGGDASASPPNPFTFFRGT